MYPAFYVSLLILYVVNITVHSIGLFSLISIQRRTRSNIERMLITNLSCVELLSNLLRISSIPFNQLVSSDKGVLSAAEAIYAVIILNTGVFFLFWSSMFYITLDRFLHVKLNLKYGLYFTRKRIVYLLVATWITFIGMGISFAIAYSFHPVVTLKTIDFYIKYIETSLEGVFIVFAVFVYGYIFHRFRETREDPSSYGARKQLQGNSRKFRAHKFINRRQKSALKTFLNSRFYISALLVSTFLAFSILPNLVQYLIVFCRGEISEERIIAGRVAEVSFAISDCSDAFIYVFLDHSVRSSLLKTIQRNCRRCSNADKNDEYFRRKSTKQTLLEETPL